VVQLAVRPEFVHRAIAALHAVLDSLSLHDALPISPLRARLAESPARHDLRPRLLDVRPVGGAAPGPDQAEGQGRPVLRDPPRGRSEEHTSELQSRVDLVCRLLLEKTKALPRDTRHL